MYGLRAIAAATALITFTVYLPTLGNGFVNWDDPVYFFDNPHIRNLDWGFVKWVSTAVVSSNWHPLTMLSHAVDFQLFGATPLGPHLINSFLHSINTALVAIISFRLINHVTENKEQSFTLGAAFIAALLFAVHPQHVESVAWISERKDLLSALFYILCLLSYIRYSTGLSKKILFFVLALFFMFLSLISKPMAITVPFTLLILDFYPLQRIAGAGKTGRTLIEKVPFLALAVIFIIITLATQKEGAPPEVAGIIATLPMVISSYAFYLYKFVMPLELSPLYPFPITSVFPIYKAAIAIIGAILLSYACVKKFKDPRPAIAVWAWFIVTLAPVSGIIKIGTQGAADRYTYLPTISLCLIAGLGALALFRSASTGVVAKLMKKGSRKAAVGLIIVISALLINITIKQISVWKDPISFWSSPIEHFRELVPLAYINRAIALEDSGRIEEALADYTSAIRLKAGHAISHNNRGRLLNMLGRYGLAIDDFNESLKYDSNSIFAYNNRGISFAALGRYALAIKDFNKAINIDPTVAEPYKNLSDALRATKRPKEAKRARAKAIELGFRY